MTIRVLLVEDNDLNRDMLSRRLEMRDLSVTCAIDGAEGCQLAVDLVPDVIVMDMSLPVIDGWEATRRLRELEATRDIPIIALTAHVMPEDREKALNAGCNDFEGKPVNFESLVEKIRQYAGSQ